MTRSSPGGGFRAVLIAAALTLPLASMHAQTKRDASTEFFADRRVRTFSFTVAESDLNALRQNPREYVRGIMRQGDTVLKNIGLHLKGMGSFRPLEDKPSFAVKFDQFTPDQEYCGLTKLMFNNSAQDLSYLAEYLATGLFRDAGLPAARVTYARVQLNGRDLGLYILIEAMNKRFLKQHFQRAEGNLYEGYLMDIHQPLELDSGTDQRRVDLRTLLMATTVPDPAQRFERLSRVLDVDRFAAFAAMEILVSHWDGYALHTNNYRLYHDPATDKMVFITHGLDWAFRRPNVSIKAPMKSIVGRALFQTPEGRRLYDERLRMLFTNVFKLDLLTNRLNDAWARIRSAGLASNEIGLIEKRVGVMRDRIVQRKARVAEQLAGIEPAPLQFDENHLARPAGWRDEPDVGKATLDEVQIERKRALHIKSFGGNFRASWRTWIYLEPGRYRFEGFVRTAGIPQGSGGAGLRISGDTRNVRLAGDSPWRPLGHEFVVTEDTRDVELVCELRTYSGAPCEAWFDLDSLHVRRIE